MRGFLEKLRLYELKCAELQGFAHTSSQAFKIEGRMDQRKSKESRNALLIHPREFWVRKCDIDLTGKAVGAENQTNFNGLVIKFLVASSARRGTA